MVKYIIKRFLIMIPTLLLIMFVAFMLTINLIGSNAREFSTYGDGDKLDAFFETINAGDNKITKFVRYTYDAIVYRDLGTDTRNLKIRIKGTLEIAALGFGVAVIIGIPAGIGSAVNHNGWKDNVLSVLTLIMASIPSFCLALFLVLLLALHLRLLPVFGLYSWKGYIIPTLVLGAGGIAMTTRMTRSAVLEILNLPYITTLRAKGMSERKILWVHVLKNALPPIISVMNNVAISVLCSTIVVENFFTVVGIGTMLVSAVGNRSQHQVLACTLVLAVVILVINFITDVCYILTNPRLRMEQSKKSGSKEKENG